MKDTGILNLLELNDTEYTMENGYWLKIEAWKVEKTQHIPHGIKYCLTLHDKFNQRIFGMDNADAVNKSRDNFNGKVITHDHSHEDRQDKGTPYHFISAEQLLIDFFTRVDVLIKALEEI